MKFIDEIGSFLVQLLIRSKADEFDWIIGKFLKIMRRILFQSFKSFWKSFIFAQLQTKFSKLHFLRHLQLRNWFYPVLSLSTKQPRPLNWEGNRVGPYQCAHFKLIDTSLYQTPIRKYIWPIGKAKQLRWYLTTAIIYKKWLT